MYNFLSLNVLIFLIYVLFTKIVGKFWSRDVTYIRVLAYFELKISKDF